MSAEELLHLGIGGQVVDRPLKTVALVRSEQVLDRKPSVAQRDHDLLGFGLVHARIVRSLDDEKRRFDLRRRVER